MPANCAFDFPVSLLLRDSNGSRSGARLSATLNDHGWIDEDTAALDAAIELLDGGDTEHETAKDNKKGFTQGRNLVARLAYPATKAAKDETILVARNHYLLDEFPPRYREKAEATTPPPTPPAHMDWRHRCRSLLHNASCRDFFDHPLDFSKT